MLSELRIENFAIIDRLELKFHPGLNIFTGETGAGKSIIIDAVESLLGSRADATQVRAGAERANLEATFEIPEAVSQNVQAILEREALVEEISQVTLGREIRTNGRSVARVNGRQVSVGLLSELGEYLVDVHGQSEHLSLLRVRKHLGLLDRFAQVEDVLVRYQNQYAALHNLRKELQELRQAETDAARRQDILTYQINEIESARLRPGEEEELRDERNRLANAEGIAAVVQQALQLLDDGLPESPAITDLLGQVVTLLGNLARMDPKQNHLSEQVQAAQESVEDATASLRDYLERIEFNPKRLDQVEDRLNLLHNLKRKYGDTIQAVLAFAEKSRQQLDQIAHAGERIVALEAEEVHLLEQLGKDGTVLSHKRHAAAEKLEKAMEGELDTLKMSGAHFKVAFETRLHADGVPLEDGRRVAFDAHGLETVEFLVAPNPGEGLKPLVKIASGGETSRLMLAIKNVLARADQVPTLIFDEIDQGIGGRVGSVVGRKLWDLARQHQVLCVTHLPQLAAFGEQHLQVQKLVLEGRTVTQVESLSGEKRLLELAQMMGEVSDGTRQSAQELIETARQAVQPV
ncbi:MAG TPA: DNA repair protein RecN [Anaerolineales bacterium]|nr:DNA repair protein RecN [Anaerolineales bacterium]